MLVVCFAGGLPDGGVSGELGACVDWILVGKLEARVNVG